MEISQILDPSHPSFGTKKAVFIFQMDSGKLIFVEAKNPHAIASIERIAIHDQKVSDYCKVVAVIRDYRDCGVRQENVQEMEYVDFMSDIVDRRRVMKDIVAFNAMCLSMSTEEIAYLKQKIKVREEAQSRKAVDLDEEYVSIPDIDDESVEEPHFIPVGDSVIQALCSIGYRKKQVESWAANFDATGMSDSQLIKVACRSLSRSA